LPKSTVSSLMLFSICVLYCCKYFGPSEKMLLITVFCMSAKRKYLNIVLLVSWVCVALLFYYFYAVLLCVSTFLVPCCSVRYDVWFVLSPFLHRRAHVLFDWLIDFWCLTPLSAIFQLYHGDQF
jgi:hypothetical protein